jgi:hypothetical protein
VAPLQLGCRLGETLIETVPSPWNTTMRQLADPYPPVIYFLHTVLGVLGVLLAVVALAGVKGSSTHVRAGWGFVIASVIAALTAVAFSVTSPSPLSVASALMVLSLVSSAVLALRPVSVPIRRAEGAATAVMGLAWLMLATLGAFAVAVALGFASPPPEAGRLPWYVLALPLLYAAFPTYFLVDDRRFRRLGSDRSSRAYPRHLSRMAFAFAIAVHAPVVSFADDLQLHLYVAFFGPFLLWPAILFTLRRHPRLRARRVDARVATGRDFAERGTSRGAGGW